jgi:capsid protein
VEPVFVDPKTPGNNFAPFMLHQFIEAAMGLGLGYATVTRDYSKHTFSGLKVDESDTRAQIEPEQFDLIDLLLRPSRAFWTRLEIATGRLAAPEFFRSADWAMAMSETMWRGPAKPVLDENKRAGANEQNLVNGLDSPQSMVAEDGEDLYEVTENIMAYKGFLDARKFPYPGWLRKWLGQPEGSGGAAPPADSSAEKIDEEERKALALSEGVTV